jgi:glucosyl-dolichyl phosphate glucuronosyltransferase
VSFVIGQPAAPMASGAAVTVTADVVFCTYTLARWEVFVRAVESVLAQEVLPQRLIIVVDHNDELVARCRQEWGSGSAESPVEIIIVASQFPGRQGSSRNTALLLARAEIVSFLDDDAVAEPDWLKRLLAVYATCPGAFAVGGASRPNYAAPRPSWFPPDFDWVFGCHYDALPDRLAPVRRLIGTSMSVRRDAMLDVGGFHADDYDDMDLSHRIAHAHGPTAVLYEPRAEVHHHVPADRMTWSYFWRRCYYVNRNKVAAFDDMGEGSSIRAELRFGAGVLLTLVHALLAAVTGRPRQMRQALAAVVGLALGGCGFVAGRVRLALGHRPEVLTTGLSVEDTSMVRALATDNA